jgi:dGTPase
VDRTDRRRPESPKSSRRTDFQRDCDRLLYSSAFRRLANVTQVVAADQGYVFHNRLTHALKVAQIGKRLAQYFLDVPNTRKIVDELGGLDADVVEAAGLAHDLGHPPFGHLAEEKLDELITGKKVASGFNGNAQSFRIVTKLAIRSEEEEGLNLTHAVLNAVLKYPWKRGTQGEKAKKWGAYASESDDFNWARAGLKCPSRRTLEAELMDFADDIAYSVYDIEDFYRAGMIPLDRLAVASDKPNEPAPETSDFFDGVSARWKRLGKTVPDEKPYRKAFLGLSKYFPVVPYSGKRSERAFLRDMTSVFVGRYMRAISLRRPKNCKESVVKITKAAKQEITMLKELTWQYVIENPALATQQQGYARVIESLFSTFFDAAKDGHLAIFPPIIRERLTAESDKEVVTRVVADFIASMTEQHALEMYQRLTGISFGSFLKTLV